MRPTRGTSERRTWTTVRGDGGPLDRPDPMRLRGFIPIEDVDPNLAGQAADPPMRRAARPRRASGGPPATGEPPARVATPVVRRAGRRVPVDDWEARVSLFGEAEL